MEGRAGCGPGQATPWFGEKQSRTRWRRSSPLSRGPAAAQGRGGWGLGIAPLARSAQTFRLRRWNARGRLLVALGVFPALAAAGRGGADPGRGTFKSAAPAPGPGR